MKYPLRVSIKDSVQPVVCISSAHEKGESLISLKTFSELKLLFILIYNHTGPKQC